MPSPDLSPLTRVAYWAEARERAKDEYDYAMTEYKRAVRDAGREGRGPTEIADVAGVTRQAIHSQLRKQERSKT